MRSKLPPMGLELISILSYSRIDKLQFFNNSWPFVAFRRNLLGCTNMHVVAEHLVNWHQKYWTIGYHWWKINF